MTSYILSSRGNATVGTLEGMLLQFLLEFYEWMTLTNWITPISCVLHIACCKWILLSEHAVALGPISYTTLQCIRASSTIIGSLQLSALTNISPIILIWRLFRVSFHLSSQAAMPSSHLCHLHFTMYAF